MTKKTCSRYHDFSYGHRVHGHENKCGFLHGHNGRVTFTCSGEIDAIGRIIDFGVINTLLCNWLEENWDHKLLLWEEDPILEALISNLPDEQLEGLAVVPFNPTAENMAQYLLEIVGPGQLQNTRVTLCHVELSETRKCSASASL